MVTRPAGVLLLGVALMVVASCGEPHANKAGGQRARPPIVLAIADHESRGRDLGEFIEAVSRLSGGSMRIAVRGPWRQFEIDYERGIVADVRAGRVDVGIVGVRSSTRSASGPSRRSWLLSSSTASDSRSGPSRIRRSGRCSPAPGNSASFRSPSFRARYADPSADHVGSLRLPTTGPSSSAYALRASPR